MGLLKRLFSSPDTVASTVKSAIGGLDDIVYTDQEKAEKTQAAQNIYAKLWEAAVPSALSRRIIASVIVGVWALLILAAIVAYPIYPEAADFYLAVLRDMVLQPMNIVIGFYFLKQIVTEYRK